MRVPVSRPRVFMNDLELAMEFPSDGAGDSEALVTGPPTSGFSRAQPPEMISGKPFDPFKADIWQLFRSYIDLKVGSFPSVRKAFRGVLILR